MPNDQTHILSVNLEDYFQAAALRRVVPSQHWPRFAPRIEKTTENLLDMLDRHNARATFFTLGWLADHAPDVILEIARRGHEIASLGYHGDALATPSPAAFRDDALRARDTLERITGTEVLGFRPAQGALPTDTVEAFKILAWCGYRYDSSIRPFGRAFFNDTNWRSMRSIERLGWSLAEVPHASVSLLGYPLPAGDSTWLRHLPENIWAKLLERRSRQTRAPWHFTFHAWEMDPGQPMISALSRLDRLRHYRNLDRMHERIETILQTHHFAPIAAHLDFEPKPVTKRVLPEKPSPTATKRAYFGTRTRATVVVPCHNEEEGLPHLARALDTLAEKNGWLDLSFVVVDDASTDGTWAQMQALFAGREAFDLVRHEQRRGVAAATMTGIRQAWDEIVCGIDADCSFDPQDLAEMIPLLQRGVDMVQAAPRRAGSKASSKKISNGLSRLYATLLTHKFESCTAPFRVYRRSAVRKMELRHQGYAGMAEIFVRLDQAGHTMVQLPVEQDRRLFGRSKNKPLAAWAGHLGLLGRLALNKLTHRMLPAPSADHAEQEMR